MVEKDPKERTSEEDSYFEEIESFDKLSDKYKNCHIKETMFMNNYEPSIRKELSKCLRVFPHD
jgi:hypothetical protein